MEHKPHGNINGGAKVCEHVKAVLIVLVSIYQRRLQSQVTEVWNLHTSRTSMSTKWKLMGSQLPDTVVEYDRSRVC